VSDITLQDRLKHGNLEIPEVIALRKCSKSKFYQDKKAGRVKVKKHGRKSVVGGPEACRYIASEPSAA
jgi:hypothetical protein